MHRQVIRFSKGSRELEETLEQALRQVSSGELVCGMVVLVTKDIEGKKDAQFYSAGELSWVEAMGWTVVLQQSLCADASKDA